MPRRPTLAELLAETDRRNRAALCALAEMLTGRAVRALARWLARRG